MVKNDKSVKVVNNAGGPFGGTFLVTYIGAAVYFVQQSDGFWGFVLAMLEALVWPAFVVHRALQLLNI